MSSQTESYIVLKPIAERFNKVAKEISDDDIKYIIKEAMKEQIKGAFDFDKIGEITEEYVDQHKDEINEMIFNSINERMRMASRY